MKKTKYRIVHMIDDPVYGTYYCAQKRARFLGIPYWSNIYFPVNPMIDEFRCDSFEEAKARLKEYKRKNTCEVLYEEED